MSREKSDNFWAEGLRILAPGATQAEMAEWLDEALSTINGYMKGTSRPNIDFLMKLASKGVNLNWFMTRKGDPYQEPGELAGLPAGFQAFAYRLGGIPPKLVKESLKAYNDLEEFQKNTKARSSERRMAYRILGQQIEYKKKELAT